MSHKRRIQTKVNTEMIKIGNNLSEFSVYSCQPNTKKELEQIVEKDGFKELKLEKNYVPIYYNAWNNDSHIDPINSIIFNIIKEHDILKDYQKESSDVIDKIASCIDIVNIWSNGSVKELVTTLKGKDTIPEITTMENLKETYLELWGSKNSRPRFVVI